MSIIKWHPTPALFYQCVRPFAQNNKMIWTFLSPQQVNRFGRFELNSIVLSTVRWTHFVINTKLHYQQKHDDVIKWKRFPRYWPLWGEFCALNKRLGKQSGGWWLETPSRSLWRHCDGVSMWMCICHWLDIFLQNRGRGENNRDHFPKSRRYRGVSQFQIRSFKISPKSRGEFYVCSYGATYSKAIYWYPVLWQRYCRYLRVDWLIGQS